MPCFSVAAESRVTVDELKAAPIPTDNDIKI
jgi:hypothetical protein